MLDMPCVLTDDGILRTEPQEGQMAEQASRLDFLEGRVEEQSRNWERLFADVGRVDQKIDALGIAMSARIDTTSERLFAEIGRLDQKIDSFGARLDQKIDALATRVDTRYDALDRKLDRKFDGLHAEQATQFRWTIGIMTALITGVLAAILTR
jgi:hypothetical protein